MSDLKPCDIDCPVCLGKGIEHVCSWVCVEIKCSYCKGTGKAARPAAPAPIDRGFAAGVEAEQRY